MAVTPPGPSRPAWGQPQMTHPREGQGTTTLNWKDESEQVHTDTLPVQGREKAKNPSRLHNSYPNRTTS
eukprot:764856-Pyramimonas_sp.AAC.1